MEEREFLDHLQMREAACALRSALKDFYDWCGKDYPGWAAVEAALARAEKAGITEEGVDG
jgi:hypothetical protein